MMKMMKSDKKKSSVKKAAPKGSKDMMMKGTPTKYTGNLKGAAGSMTSMMKKKAK